MSRLDSAIRRLIAQRACLESAANLIRGVQGHILELGLGNGRTYDHLRTLLPDRSIFVFDRQIAAHPSCVPVQSLMVLGDVLETLPTLTERIGGRVALVHSDIGSGNPIENCKIADALPRMLAPLLAPGAVVVGDRDLKPLDWKKLSLPTGLERERYYMWRVPANHVASGR